MKHISYLINLLRFAFRHNPLLYLSILLSLFSAAVELLAMSSLFPLFAIVSGGKAPELGIIPRFLHFLGVTNVNSGTLFGTFIALLTLRILTQLFAQSLSTHLGRRVMAQLASRSFDTIMRRLSIQEINKNSIGYYISLAGDESFRASTLIVSMTQFVATVALALIYFLAIVRYSPATAVMIIMFLLISLISLAGVLRASHKLGGRQIQESRAASSVFLDSLNNLKAVRAFSSESYVVSLYRTLIVAYTRTLFLIDEMAILFKLIPILLLLAILGIWLNLNSTSIEGVGVAFVVTISAYLMRLFPVIGLVVTLLMKIISDAKSGKDVTSLLSEQAETNNDVTQVLGHVSQIDFSDVYFSYVESSQKPILEAVSFTLSYGKFYALVGKSGIGKSTLIDLLLKFHLPTSGRLLINGMSINEISESEIRRKVILVSQEAAIFDDTVLNNICMGKAATLQEVRAACEIACIDKVIESMGQGYETRLQYQGKNLSGGQRQRIAIARAVLRSPDVLILDESTSALDKATQNQILENILREYSNKIVIFVTHDPQIMSRVNEVVDLEKVNLASVSLSKNKKVTS